jgi:succinate dehydrogenase / fumarate reductase cytochrome b subunit
VVADRHGLRPGAYATFRPSPSSWIGRVVVFGYTWALLHHLLSGIRHLIWDLGYGFGPSEREWLTRAPLIGGITLTIVVWIDCLCLSEAGR